MKHDYFGIRLEHEDGKAIRREAARQGLSYAELIRNWIEPRIVDLLYRQNETLDVEAAEKIKRLASGEVRVPREHLEQAAAHLEALQAHD